MIYITSLGIGAKKYTKKDEALEKSKVGIDALIVGLTFDEYTALIAAHEKDHADMLFKVSSEQQEVQRVMVVAKREIEKRESEIKRLQSSVENYKEAVGRWQKKAQGEKGITQKKKVDGKSIQSITIVIGNRPKRYSMRMIIETTIPSNMPLDRVKEYFTNIKINELVPEIEDVADYRIMEVSCGSKKDVWNVVILR